VNTAVTRRKIPSHQFAASCLTSAECGRSSPPVPAVETLHLSLRIDRAVHLRNLPLAKSVFDLLRRREFDSIAILVLLGIATSGVALLLGGSPKILLVRESLFTGVFGVACFVSLLLPRPMMFYFGRFFIAGTDPLRRERFNANWALPEVRFANRLITIVWGIVYVADSSSA